MVVRIDPPALRSAASTLRGSAAPLDGVATQVGSMSGAQHPDVADAVESFGVAWRTALEVMADDVQYVAGRADAATDMFEAADGRLADLADDPDAIPPE